MAKERQIEREQKVPARANDKMMEVLQANDIIRSNKDRLIHDPLSKIIYFFFFLFPFVVPFIFYSARPLLLRAVARWIPFHYFSPQ